LTLVILIITLLRNCIFKYKYI